MLFRLGNKVSGMKYYYNIPAYEPTQVAYRFLNEASVLVAAFVHAVRVPSKPERGEQRGAKE